MKIIHTIFTCFIVLLPVVITLFFNSLLFGDPVQKGSITAENTLRFIVFDFTSSGTIDSGIISRVFREEFKKRNSFSVLDIEEINKDIIVRKPAAFDTAGTRNRAVFIGKSVNAHKVVIGEIRTAEQRERLTVDVIDIQTGTTDFSMYLEEKQISRGKTEIFANSVADRILGIETGPSREQQQRIELQEKVFPRKHGAGISFGMLSPWRKIEPYLNSMLLTKAHYVFATGMYKNTDIDISIGYAQTETRSTIAGAMEMTFVPLTVSLAARFPVFSSSWMPVPVLYGGCGITYLSLSGTAGEDSISKQGVDITALAGIGLSFPLTDRVFFQLQTMLYYLYEDIEVIYYYYGAMLQYRL